MKAFVADLVDVKAFCICTQGKVVWGKVVQFAVGMDAIHPKSQLDSFHVPDHNYYSKMHFLYLLVF